MNIQTIPLSDLTPADYHARKNLQPGDAEYEKLRASIGVFGYVEPIIWNRQTGNVVGGHQRLNVLLDTGVTEESVVVVDLPPDDEKALNVALNRIGGEWDMPRLATLLDLLDTANYDLTLTGFDLTEADDTIK